MHREFIYTPTFDKRWERLKLSDTDLRELEQLLLEDPERGDTETGTGGIKKMRFAPSRSNQGKKWFVPCGLSQYSCDRSNDLYFDFYQIGTSKLIERRKK